METLQLLWEGSSVCRVSWVPSLVLALCIALIFFLKKKNGYLTLLWHLTFQTLPAYVGLGLGPAWEEGQAKLSCKWGWLE